MSNHTPGPWVVRFRNDHSAYISLGDPLKGPHKQFDIDFDARDPSDVADASLIAAAPDLLAALEELVGWQTTAPDAVVAAAHAAIDKANGGKGQA